MSGATTSKAKCSAKVKFDQLPNAERVAKYMSEKYGEEIEPYRCNQGTHFHVGHVQPLRMAIAQECQAIFNRGLQAGRGEVKEKYALKKGLEYADKIIAMAYTGRIKLDDVKPVRLFDEVGK